jgi:hypothetical protein
MADPGSFDLNPVAPAVATAAMPIAVALYVPGSGGGGEDDSPYTILPNVYCLRIDYREGHEPPVARFTYMMDDALDALMGWPSQFEKLWPIDAQGKYVVNNDDRLVVMTQVPPSSPDGKPKTVVLFDGFAQIPQIDVNAQGQQVTFCAIGVAIRLWDNPIRGRVQRDASSADDTAGTYDTRTALPCRFNPSDHSVGSQGGYIGNCVGEDNFTVDGDDLYPVFIDPLIRERASDDDDDDNNFSSYWFVSDAMAYLVALEPSPEDEGGNPYVLYPTISSLKDLLSVYAPPDGKLLNPGDAQEGDVQIRDYDATNKFVPDVMADLLGYCGFTFSFFTDTYTDGTPETYLKIQRRDALAKTKPKVLYLDANRSSSLVLTRNNVTSLHLARDSNHLVNQWRVETAPQQVEISVYLAPGYQPSASDVSDRKPFQKDHLTNATNDERRMYRWFIADECADGHYNLHDGMWVDDQPLDLTAVFPQDKKKKFTYVDRYRPGSNTLISKDKNGKPLKAVLEIKKDGTIPGDPKLEDPKGTTGWQTVNPGTWNLLKDRLGIEFVGKDPGNWVIGGQSAAGGASSIQSVDIIASTATDTTDNAFQLRLTTVIEADQTIGIPNTKTEFDVTAKKRKASPTATTRERVIDGKDHFQYCTLAPGSLYYSTQKDIAGDPADNKNPLVMRDDTDAAVNQAKQLRAAHEFPMLAGSASLPVITDYYQIGDRVKIVQGRNANLQINVGVDQGETAVYPWITAFAWDFAGNKQQTVLQFSDRRAEPQGV